MLEKNSLYLAQSSKELPLEASISHRNNCTEAMDSVLVMPSPIGFVNGCPTAISVALPVGCGCFGGLVNYYRNWSKIK